MLEERLLVMKSSNSDNNDDSNSLYPPFRAKEVEMILCGWRRFAFESRSKVI